MDDLERVAQAIKSGRMCDAGDVPLMGKGYILLLVLLALGLIVAVAISAFRLGYNIGSIEADLTAIKAILK